MTSLPKHSAETLPKHEVAGPSPSSPRTLVDRPRLYRLLDQATLAPLTIVTSPAGTGKTTLIAAWVAQTSNQPRRSVHWLAAHAHDGMEQHLLQAVGLSAADARDAVQLSRRNALESTESLLVRLEAEVDAGRSPQLVVVDDAHLLPPAQVAILSDILFKRPEVVRLLLASRHDLALPGFKLEMHGLASTLRGMDLRFTDAEAGELIHAHAEGAAEEAVGVLQSRADGWAAALVLGARTLVSGARSQVAASSVATTDQPVLDYLLGEAFTTLPRATRRVLLGTFSEPRITPERIAVLTGDPAAVRLLSELAQDGVLVTRYSHSGGEDDLFSYHPLLIEMLRRRVAGVRADAAVVAAAHARGARRDAAQGNGIAALKQAVEARDPELLAGLLVEHGVTLLCAAEEHVVGAALANLPDDAMDRFPYLLGIAGLYRRTTGDIAGAVQLSSRATEAVERLRSSVEGPAQPFFDALGTDALLLRLWVSRFGWLDAEGAIASAREALAALEGTKGMRTDREAILDPARVVWLSVELAAAEIRTGDLPTAAQHIDSAVVGARVIGHKRLLSAALSHRAIIEMARGQAQTSALSADEALAHAAEAGVLEDAFLDRARLALGWSAFLRLDLEHAAERLDELTMIGSAEYPDLIVTAYTTLLRAMVLAEHDQLDEARRLLAATPEARGPLPGFLTRALSVLRWHCAAAAGDLDGMHESCDELARVGFDVEADLLKVLGDTSAEVLGDVISKLEQLLPPLSAMDPTMAASAATTRVALLLKAGDRPSACKGMSDVLNRVAPQHVVYAMTPGLASDPDFLEVLSDETQRRDAHPFAARALRSLVAYRERAGTRHESLALDADSTAPNSLSTRSATDYGREATLDGFPVRLTSREAEVLVQLALGSSYAEIGLALFITENTVKTHLASIYRKLGVDKRSAALRVARRIGLL